MDGSKFSLGDEHGTTEISQQGAYFNVKFGDRGYVNVYVHAVSCFGNIAKPDSLES